MFMDESQLKIVNISSKGFKKELLVSKKEVDVLRSFLKEMIKGEMMVINTNMGLGIYYYDFYNHEDFIVNSFLLLAACKGKSKDHFFIQSLNNNENIRLETHRFFEKLIKNPLLFKSYSKSLCHQLNSHYEANSGLINELLHLWQDALFQIDTKQELTRTILSNMSKLEDSFIEKASKPLLQQLIRESLSDLRIN